MPKELQWTGELINSFWDGFSQTPLKDLAFAKNSGPKLLDYIGHHMPPTAKCLDFGSGGGDLVALLIERGCQAAAFEPSAERSKALMNMPFATSPNFLGVIDNDSTQTFDVVIAAEVLEHVLEAELPAVVKRLRSFLKTGGTLIATTPNNEDLVSNSAYCPVSDVVFHRWQHLRSFTAESLDACLSTGGFRRIEDHRVDYSSYGELSEELERQRRMFQDLKLKMHRQKRKMHYLRRFGPLYSLMAPLLRSRIEDEIQAKARIDRPQTEDNVQVDLRIGAKTNLIYVGKAE